MKKADAPPPYGLEPDIELAVTLAACQEPRFHVSVGRAIDPERLIHPSAKLLVAAAHAIATRTGQSPSWAVLAIQHLSTLMSAGKVTFDQVQDAKDYLIEAVALPSVHVDELIASVVPVIQRVMHKEAVVTALDDFKNRADPADTAVAFEEVAKLGKSSGTDISEISVIVSDPEFFLDSNREVLRFGIPELDEAIEGGMETEALGIVVGGSGAGKSMALAHASVEALLCGHDIMYVTLELSKKRATGRIVRNLIDMTKRESRVDPGLAMQRYQAVRAAPGVGRFVIAEAPPLVTSPRDINRLVDQAMRENPGFNPRGFFVDFMDKLRCNAKASLYEDMLAVADGLRSIAVERRGWMWTASQSDRKSTNRPWLDLDAIADSMNKVRSADIVIAIGRTEEDKAADQIRFSVPKRREGEGAHTRIGPIPWDPEHGRITVISNRVFPW